MDIKFSDFEDNDRGRQMYEQLEKTLKERTSEGLAYLAKLTQANEEIERLREALREAMDDTPGWYDLARAALREGE